MRFTGRAVDRRIVAGVLLAAVVAVGVGVGGVRAGILSRAESGGGSSRGAAAAIGTAETGDVVVVGETTATGGESLENSATTLRVGDTKVGEAPFGDSNPLAGLNDSATEGVFDIGCDDWESTHEGYCVGLLRTRRLTTEQVGQNSAEFLLAEIGTPDARVVILPSVASQNSCSGIGFGALVLIEPSLDTVDGSQATSTCGVGGDDGLD